MLCSAHYEQICNTNKAEKPSTWSRRLKFGLICRAELLWAGKVYQILSQILNLCDTNLCYTSKSSLMFVLVFPSCAVRPHHNCDKKETQRK